MRTILSNHPTAWGRPLEWDYTGDEHRDSWRVYWGGHPVGTVVLDRHDHTWVAYAATPARAGTPLWRVGFTTDHAAARWLCLQARPVVVVVRRPPSREDTTGHGRPWNRHTTALLTLDREARMTYALNQALDTLLT